MRGGCLVTCRSSLVRCSGEGSFQANELESREFLSLHHCKERSCVIKKYAKPPTLTQPVWFSFFFSFGKPPRPRYQRMLRGVSLIAQPPLAMEGNDGLCHRNSHLQTFFFSFIPFPLHRPYSHQKRNQTGRR